jgi:hypothetical protein
MHCTSLFSGLAGFLRSRDGSVFLDEVSGRADSGCTPLIVVKVVLWLVIVLVKWFSA